MLCFLQYITVLVENFRGCFFTAIFSSWQCWRYQLKLWMLAWCEPKQHASETNRRGYNPWPLAHQQYQIRGAKVSSTLSFWPITLCKVTLSQVSKRGCLIGSHTRKLLGLPRCLCIMGPYGNRVISLAITNLAEENRCAKVELDMILRQSKDIVVGEPAPIITEGSAIQH